MAKDRDIFKLDDLDDWLCSTGFLYPTNNVQMERFDKLYKDFDFKLKDAKIDIDTIVNGSLRKKNVFKLENNFEDINFSDLKMAARNGIEDLPNDIVNKMYSKHRKKSDDKE